MGKQSRVVTATEEDLERDFGSGRLVIGFPVRPPSNDEAPPEAEQPSADEDQPAGS